MDLAKFILPTKLDNTDNEQKTGNKGFETEDLIYLDSKTEVEDISDNKRITYPTDYAIMNYALMSSSNQEPKDRKSCRTRLRSACLSDKVDKINTVGDLGYSIVNNTYDGLCPALHLNLSSVISARSANRDNFKISMVSNGENELYHTIEFGEYPKTYVGNIKNKRLEIYSAGILRSTGKKYTGHFDDNGNPSYNEEYMFEGQKYVRVLTKKCDDDSEYSDGTMAPENGTYMWARVEPIVWKIRNWEELPKEINPNGSGTATYIDVRTDEAIMSGIPFYPDDNNQNCSMWQNSIIRSYFNGYNLHQEIDKGNGNKKYKAQKNFDFTKQNFLAEAFDIQLNKINVETNKKEMDSEMQEPIKKSRIEKLNPDTSLVSSRRRMTDTEIIKSWIDAGQSVLLRGPSGIGKTERIKKLYPDLIYIKLTNNMFPEKVVGSMNLQTGQPIPPDFAKEAFMACATDEERKSIKENIQNLYDLADTIYERSKSATGKTVIMLDELLNVKPAVQSLVYTLVLNKIVETGKGLKLPANTVVVATGNQKKYSAVAEDLAEPLEKRFDHILDMEPKVSEWIYEYAIPNKIHPTVIGYIFSKYQEKRRSENIKDMGYFYEEPEVGEKNLDKNGCRGRTNDPRGWVSISNTLYAFEEDLKNGKFVGKDVESLLKVTIGSKLRNEWAQEFFDFYNHPTLTVEDVIEKKYTKIDLPTTVNERFGQMASLLNANMGQVEEVRNFIRKHCDPEYLAVYDIYWAGNDEERMEKIAELRELSQETFDEINKEVNENKHNFKLTLDEFWDRNENKVISVRNIEEEMLIRKAFDNFGAKWCDGKSYLDREDGHFGYVGFFINNHRYWPKNSVYNVDNTIYDIYDIDLTPYIKGEDLTRFNEICQKQTQENTVTM